MLGFNFMFKTNLPFIVCGSFSVTSDIVNFLSQIDRFSISIVLRFSPNDNRVKYRVHNLITSLILTKNGRLDHIIEWV